MPGLTAPERFRLAGRAVLREPGEWRLHIARVEAAADLEGKEPTQGALVDLLAICMPAPDQGLALIKELEACSRIAPHVAEALRVHLGTGRPLPRVTRWATRYSILATASLDVPERARLCSVDDSHRVAAEAVEKILEGDAEHELEFLSHCVETVDTLAFLLARRGLRRAGHHLAPSWDRAAETLESRASSKK